MKEGMKKIYAFGYSLNLGSQLNSVMGKFPSMITSVHIPSYTFQPILFINWNKKKERWLSLSFPPHSLSLSSTLYFPPTFSIFLFTPLLSLPCLYSVLLPPCSSLFIFFFPLIFSQSSFFLFSPSFINFLLDSFSPLLT